MKCKIYFIGILILISHHLNAQNKNDFEVGLYNIGFGGLVGGIGSIINKKPNEKTGKVFLKGFYQGALGGYLIFESKRLVGKFAETEDYTYVWPSKILNSAGASMIENAAANRDFWERWHLNIAFNRFEYNFERNKLSYRIMPFALGNTIYGFIRGNLDTSMSLKTGTFVFSTDEINSSNNSEYFNAGAYSISNSIVYLKSIIDLNRVISHELIHIYQYESFSGFNAFFDKPLNNWFNNTKWFSTYKKLFYTDINYLIFQGIYFVNKDYNTNLFEKEARFYTELD
ncbi:MAG: hypothetical protein R2785_00880 [Flavobacteriaceae bacterium]